MLRSSLNSCKDGRTTTPQLIKVSASAWLDTALNHLVPSGIDLDKDSMKTVYEKFGLEPGTQDFIGHAMALYLDDE